MKLSHIFSVVLAVGQGSLVLGAVINPTTNGLESRNVTEAAELSDLFDSLSFLPDNEHEDETLESLLDAGDKIPGQNFLSLCDGDHGGDAASINLVNLDPPEPVR